ncbi:MAG: 50S ribosomal protein L13 [Euryarchaeota archaeon]|nr:50S ribosomal protein L13 [Euryarchaeota archaeon]
MIIDGEGHILGRLASIVSKKLLNGENIVVLNSEKIVISGSKEWVHNKYKQRIDRASISNPRKMGPKYPRRPDDIFRRTVRGMLPYKNTKGREAFKSLKAYIGVPKEFEESEALKISEAEIKNIKKGIKLGEVSKLFGTKY